MLRRLALAAAAGTLALLALGGPASAHVTVNPREATKGGFAKLAFRVPNERPDSATTTLEVNFPKDQPLAFVSVRPHEGWTFEVTRAKLDKPITMEGDTISEAVSKITWTATGATGGVKPGEFDEFEVSVGPLPEDVDQLVFKALQTYANGEVVRWIDEPAPGAEAEHPAPVLTLTAAASDASTTPTTAPDDSTAGSEAAASQDDVDRANTLAVVALVVGGLGVLVGALGLFRGGRRG